MIIDVTGTILDYKGKALTQPTGRQEDGKLVLDEQGQPEVEDVVYRDVLIQALNTVRPGVDIPPAEKVRAYRLSIEIQSNDKVELTAEDVVLLKKVTGENLSHLGAGRCLDLLAEPDQSRGVEDPAADPPAA